MSKRDHYSKENWGPGPWQEEPDNLEWRDAATGLPCLIVCNDLGALCGYVGVPPGHPCHGKGYDHEACRELEAHGGLTYANHCQGKICHTPAPGEPTDVWWLGFDCAHFMDIVPGMEAFRREQGFAMKRSFMGRTEQYRDMPYVQAECADLAGQLAAMSAAGR